MTPTLLLNWLLANVINSITFSQLNTLALAVK